MRADASSRVGSGSSLALAGGLGVNQASRKSVMNEKLHREESAASDARWATSRKATEALTKWDKLARKSASYLYGEYYFSSLPEPLAATKTDADGKFSFKLKKGIRVALAANGKRLVGDHHEFYYWLIWVSVDANSSKVLLSNDNLMDANPSDALVKW